MLQASRFTRPGANSLNLPLGLWPTSHSSPWKWAVPLYWSLEPRLSWMRRIKGHKVDSLFSYWKFIQSRYCKADIWTVTLGSWTDTSSKQTLIIVIKMTKVKLTRLCWIYRKRIVLKKHKKKKSLELFTNCTGKKKPCAAREKENRWNTRGNSWRAFTYEEQPSQAIYL